jgi:hypothetical protein
MNEKMEIKTKGAQMKRWREREGVFGGNCLRIVDVKISCRNEERKGEGRKAC